MNEVTASLICLFAACWLLSTFYWNVVYKVFSEQLYYMLLAKQDEMLRLNLENKVDRNSPEFQNFVASLRKLITIVPTLSLASFLLFIVRNPKLGITGDNCDQTNSSAKISSLYTESVYCGMGMLLLNSPVLAIPSLITAALFVTSKRFDKDRLFNVAKQFVEGIPDNPAIATHI